MATVNVQVSNWTSVEKKASHHLKEYCETEIQSIKEKLLCLAQVLSSHLLWLYSHLLVVFSYAFFLPFFYWAAVCEKPYVKAKETIRVI